MSTEPLEPKYTNADLVNEVIGAVSAVQDAHATLVEGARELKAVKAQITDVPAPSKIVLSGADGKLDAGWFPEDMAGGSQGLFAVCDTAGSIACKSFTLNKFRLAPGVRLAVMFSYVNSVENPTLSINGETAVPVLWQGANLSAGTLLADRVYELIYTGSAWITQERSRGMADSTIRARLAVVRTCYRWAVAGGLLASNPLGNIKLPAAKPYGEAPPTRQEIARIFRAAPEHLRRVIVLGLTTGARIGPSELFRLKWEHVHLQEGYIAMPQASKGAKSKFRHLPIRPDLRRFLEQWQAANGADEYVISFRGKPLKSVHGTWRQALIRAGISRRIRPYDLRHAFATEALEAGADLKAIIELMGHANERMIIRHYRHVNAKSLQTAINRSKALNLCETKARALAHTGPGHGLNELNDVDGYQVFSGQGVASPPPSQGAPG